MSEAMTDLPTDLQRSPYAQAALCTRLQPPALWDLAFALYAMDNVRCTRTGKRMTQDHLRQEAMKLEKEITRASAA